MRKILVVVDMQKDYIDGVLGTKEAVAIVPAVKAKIAEYDSSNVYYTLDTHEKNYLQTQEGQNHSVEHCIRGTEGWKLLPELEVVLSGAVRYEKPTFGSVNLAFRLREIAGEEEIEVELVGVRTDISVVSNALLLKAMIPEVKITVDASCCAGVSPALHTAALRTMESCQIGIKNEKK